MVVDNRAGAGGNLGLDIAAKSAPDGYTIVMGESSNLTINPYHYKKLPFDPAQDVAPVALVGTVPLVLVVAATGPTSRWFPSSMRPGRRNWSSHRPATARWGTSSVKYGSAPSVSTCCTYLPKAPGL